MQDAVSTGCLDELRWASFLVSSLSNACKTKKRCWWWAITCVHNKGGWNDAIVQLRVFADPYLWWRRAGWGQSLAATHWQSQWRRGYHRRHTATNCTVLHTPARCDKFIRSFICWLVRSFIHLHVHSYLNCLYLAKSPLVHPPNHLSVHTCRHLYTHPSNSNSMQSRSPELPLLQNDVTTYFAFHWLTNHNVLRLLGKGLLQYVFHMDKYLWAQLVTAVLLGVERKGTRVNGTCTEKLATQAMLDTPCSGMHTALNPCLYLDVHQRCLNCDAHHPMSNWTIIHALYNCTSKQDSLDGVTNLMSKERG